MKKNLQLKIVSILVLLITSTLSAQSFTDGNFNYDVISGSDVQLTGYITAPTGSLTIPTTVTDGSLFYTVTSIFESAFYGCSGLTSLIIPNSVTSIQEYAFAYCSGLTSLSIGNSVTSIGYQAFAFCTGLTSLIIPNSVTSIQDSAFRNCTGLTSLSIGNSVTRIDNYAFYSCTGLTSVDVSWSTPLVIGNVFPGVTLSGVTLNVSAPGVPGDYAAAPIWQSFGTITLGTNSYQSNSNLKVYPNPANGYVTISGLVDTVNYSVYNVLGAEIRTGSTTSDQKIDIQNLSKGTYFIKLENKNTIKFIKD
jgi:hypothetical protein